MPDLYHGPFGDNVKRRLYTPGMDRVVSEVFDSFKLKHLTPQREILHLCNFWWWERKKHTVLAWHAAVSDTELVDAAVYIPSLLDQRDALEYARTIWPEVMPSAITFRFLQEYDEALRYD